MDFLKPVLGDELYTQLETKLKDNKEIKLANLASGEYVGKAKFVEVETEKKTLSEQIKERDRQLEELKKVDANGLQAKIKELEEANKKASLDYEEFKKKSAVEHAIETEILKSKGKNPKAITALLDKSKIKIDGETVLGITDQIEAIKKSDAYLFDTGTSNQGANPPPPSGGKTAKQLYEEAVAALRKNPNDQALRMQVFLAKENLRS
jgi:hypothetical protein